MCSNRDEKEMKIIEIKVAENVDNFTTSQAIFKFLKEMNIAFEPYRGGTIIDYQKQEQLIEIKNGELLLIIKLKGLQK